MLKGIHYYVHTIDTLNAMLKGSKGTYLFITDFHSRKIFEKLGLSFHTIEACQRGQMLK